MRLSLVLVVFAVCQVSFSGVEAIECYECTSCGDPFNSNGVSTASCSTCMKIKGESGGTEYVIRDCGTVLGDGCIDTTYNGVDVTLCTCSTDLCNGAALTSVSVLLVITTTALLLAKRLFE